MTAKVKWQEKSVCLLSGYIPEDIYQPGCTHPSLGKATNEIIVMTGDIEKAIEMARASGMVPLEVKLVKREFIEEC